MRLDPPPYLLPQPGQRLVRNARIWVCHVQRLRFGQQRDLDDAVRVRDGATSAIPTATTLPILGICAEGSFTAGERFSENMRSILTSR